MGMRVKAHPFWHYLLVVLLTLVRSLVGEVLWFFIGLGGYFIFVSGKSPYNVMLGLPLFLIGVGFVINSLWSEVLSVFSWKYNRGVCFLCNSDNVK